MSSAVTMINSILTYPTPLLMANCAPTKEPITILAAIINPYTKSTWPKIIKRTNAPRLDAKFNTLALPAALKKSKPNISNTNNIKEPVPPPKKPS